MNYRSIAQLAASVSRWSMSLPGDIDLVVGVPRSGLLAANLLALYRNLPFTDLEGYCEVGFSPVDAELRTRSQSWRCTQGLGRG